PSALRAPPPAAVRAAGRHWPSWPPSGEAFDDRDVGHAPALAHGLQAVALATVAQRMDERGHELGAGAAERVAERDRPAVDVEPVHVGAEALHPGERHGREGLVDLVEVDVLELHAGPGERALGCRD